MEIAECGRVDVVETTQLRKLRELGYETMRIVAESKGLDVIIDVHLRDLSKSKARVSIRK